MSKQIALGCIIILILIIPSTMGFSNQTDSAQTWYVDITNNQGPWTGNRIYPFSQIQTAIEHANSGDTIIILNGTYKETIRIDKPLIIRNMSAHQPIIDGGYHDSIITINHPHATLSGLILRNSSGSKQSCAIRCKSSTISISHCHFYRTRTGIRVQNTDHITISDCLFHTNGDGVSLIDSQQIVLTGNDFLHNGLGINSNNSSKVLIHDCYATINGIGIFLNNSSDFIIDKCAIYNNNDNQGGIFLNHCESVDINHSRIEHNGFGIKPSNSKNISINKSTIQHNTHVGIFCIESNDIYLSTSQLTSNFRFSIHCIESSLLIHRSNLFSSLVGIYAEDSTLNIKENWWGSSIGPIFFEHQKIDRIRLKSSSAQLRPISTQKYPAGATWSIDQSRCQIPNDIWLHPIIQLPGKDSDNDGVPDWWEIEFSYDPYTWDDHGNLDPDNDGLSNIEECYTYEWGSDPFQKDIFLEVDWMESRTGNPTQNRLTSQDIQMMKEVFAIKDIKLHVDHGEMGGGEQIPYQSNFSYADLRDIYWDYFLHEDMNNPRKGIFHYAIITDWGPGPGFAFIGWDSLDSFTISAQELSENQPTKERNILITGGSIHELGHTLGLTVDDHQGNDNQVATWLFTKQWLRYRQYKSCMNYWYTYRILGFSDGSHGPYDFNDWEHMDFSFFKNTDFNLPDQYL